MLVLSRYRQWYTCGSGFDWKMSQPLCRISLFLHNNAWLCVDFPSHLQRSFWRWMFMETFPSTPGSSRRCFGWNPVHSCWTSFVDTVSNQAWFLWQGRKCKIVSNFVAKGALSLHLSTVYFSHHFYIPDQLKKCIHISKPLTVIRSCCQWNKQIIILSFVKECFLNFL